MENPLCQRLSYVGTTVVQRLATAVPWYVVAKVGGEPQMKRLRIPVAAVLLALTLALVAVLFAAPRQDNRMTTIFHEHFNHFLTYDEIVLKRFV